MSEIIPPGQGPTNIPDVKIKAYAAVNKCSPFEAFTALLSQDLLDKIDAGDHAFVLKVLVENVIGKGVKR